MRAIDFPDLLEKIAALRASVNIRGEGRTTQQTEVWIASRLVPTLAHIGLIGFPLEFSFADRPDLRLQVPAGAVGIEITEVVPPAYAQADAIRNQHYPEATIDRSIFTWGAQFTAAEIHRHLAHVGRKLAGPGWAGDSVERGWAAAVNEAISVKCEKLNRPGFTICDRNWLAAYTSSPGPALNMPHAATFLVHPKALGQHSFDAIFALTDRRMVILQNGSHEVHELVV